MNSSALISSPELPIEMPECDVASAVSASGRDSMVKRNSCPMVLHVRVVTGRGGGPEKTILNSPRYLRRLGYDSKLAYLHPPNDPGFDNIRQRGKELEADVLSVPDRGPFDLAVVSRLVKICREENVSIWHGHDYKSNLLGLLVRMFWRCELVSTVHGWGVLSGRMPFYNRLDRFGLRFFRKTICVSDDLRERCIASGVPENKCCVIYNAIDTHHYRRRIDVRLAKEQLGARPDSFLIGAVGRLSEEKAFDLLIEAVCKLRQAGRQVDLWIAGDGPVRGQLEQLIATLQCQSYVRLLGHMDDAIPFYEAMDAYVLSSVREGLPNVVLEAMAMEVPVIATRIAGVPMLVEQGRSGLIVEPGAANELQRGIEQLLVAPDLRESLRNAAKQRIDSHFAFSKRMEKIVRIYDEVLGRN
jgi:glycosyltransferase involved in cell wall biosynthesis